MELRNESANKFIDISSEQTRSYVFPGGDTVMISSPCWLAVSAGGHRILDAEGISHYIPLGWIHLKWQAKMDRPHFVK